MSNGIKVTKEQKPLVMEFIAKVVLSGSPVEIKTPLEHKVAMDLVDGGAAVVVKKKNYGRIHSIKGVE